MSLFDDLGVTSAAEYSTPAPTNYGSSGGSSFDWSGVGSFFGDIAKTGMDVWAKKTLTQQNIDGQKYIEGQRLAAQQMQAYGQQNGNNSLLLIVGLAALGFMLMKA